MVVRKNDNEGVVERHSLEGVTELIQGGTEAAVLKFHRVNYDGQPQTGGKSARSAATTATMMTKRSAASSRKAVQFNEARAAPNDERVLPRCPGSVRARVCADARVCVCVCAPHTVSGRTYTRSSPGGRRARRSRTSV